VLLRENLLISSLRKRDWELHTLCNFEGNFMVGKGWLVYGERVEG
jgi:hypothetical protein